MYENVEKFLWGKSQHIKNERSVTVAILMSL